jgi:uncharacterized protein (DUF433 family)
MASNCQGLSCAGDLFIDGLRHFLGAQLPPTPLVSTCQASPTLPFRASATPGSRSKMKKAVLMQREYVERRDGAYYVTGSRVSLASIVYEYRDGAAPETIRQNFPTLFLEHIHGAIAFYLGHQPEVEAYLRELEEKWDELESTAKPASPELQSRIEEARKRLLAKQA